MDLPSYEEVVQDRDEYRQPTSSVFSSWKEELQVIRIWFQTVDEDGSGQISCNELQQALVNGNWSHFNRETCRLMINMFDKDNSGGIDEDEFVELWQFIQQWKNTFDTYDKDRSGTIDIEEMNSALYLLGHSYSNELLEKLFSQFKGRRNELEMDNFITLKELGYILSEEFVRLFVSCYYYVEAPRRPPPPVPKRTSITRSNGIKRPAPLPPRDIPIRDERKERIHFDRFIHLCVSLFIITDQFKEKDVEQNGQIKSMNYEDFMELCINAISST
ncbi:hypothetical protein SNEBB_000087 [Seison nebaliae]|nr:hypothetical protein SNEBB_000087 [Seison nebaliae]